MKFTYFKEWIMEGGAYGHLSHIHEDLDLTFGDIKQIIDDALQGKLDKETKPSEKLDGQALSFTVVDGDLKFARNKGHLKNRGEAALTADEVKTKFSGRGTVEDAFSHAVDELEHIVSKNKDKFNKIFNNGEYFASIEVIWPDNYNIILYDEPYIIFHNIIQYDESGNAIGEISQGGEFIEKTIKELDIETHKFKVSSPIKVDLVKAKDFEEKQKYFLDKLSQLMRKYNLSDDSTIEDYMIESNKKIVLDVIEGYDLSEDQINMILKRCILGDKSSINANGLKKLIGNEGYEKIVDIEKESLKKSLKKTEDDLFEIFLELGQEVLKNISSVLILSPDKEVQRIKKEIDDAIKSSHSLEDKNQYERISRQLTRLGKLGGLESILPIEGIVFRYKGKDYKFTGSFAPVNQILGFFKYFK